MKKSVIELFAGVGGFRVGLNHIKAMDENGKAIENENWKFVWADQWEPGTKKQDAYECYKKRFGDECSNENISKVDAETIPNHALLCGGFPCQDYSVAHTLSSEKGIEGKKRSVVLGYYKSFGSKTDTVFLAGKCGSTAKKPF